MAGPQRQDETVIRDRVDGAVVSILASPRSNTNAVGPIENGTLRVRVTSAAVDGAANAALVKLLSEVIGIPRGRIEILSGQSSRRKRVLFRGITSEELANRLGLD
jgi:uncharacterized protein (TIGR00251 family)